MGLSYSPTKNHGSYHFLMFGKLIIISLVGALVACSNDRPDRSDLVSSHVDTVAEDDSEFVQSALLGTEFQVSQSELVQEYQERLKEVQESALPIFQLKNLPASAAKAQDLFVNNPTLLRYLFTGEQKQAMRVEVMSVVPALPSGTSSQACDPKQCFTVTAYNFFNGASIQAVVDVTNDRIVRFSNFRDMQPDISERLTEIARDIAKSDSLVRAELERFLTNSGKKGGVDPLMSSTKTSLNRTFCERSQHLCVAPTFVMGTQALWVIVDLTEFKVAGLRWTNVGETDVPTLITEKRLSNEYVFENFCERVTSLARSGWDIDYQLTNSDGLLIKNVSFNTEPMIDSAKVVDWHVSYSSYDGFGYSDATGCPMFSSAVVVAFQAPLIEDIYDEAGESIGFSLSQDFRQVTWPAPCNYRYQEQYEFYNDGRFRVKMSNLGRGCGNRGVYRPILRVSLPEIKKSSMLQSRSAAEWVDVTSEQWFELPPEMDRDANGATHRVLQTSGKALLVQPFNDAAIEQERSFLYASIERADRPDGQHDLITLGSCCNDDFRQGPEQFIDPPEPLSDEKLVLWYVPKMENSNENGKEQCWAETRVVDGVRKVKTWACSAGLTLSPQSAGG